MDSSSEESRQKREREILGYLQQRMRAKALKAAVKPDALEEKKATKTLICTFCRESITLGGAYVSFRSPGEAVYKGKAVRTERMHPVCLNRYLRPGVTASLGKTARA